MKPLQLWCSVLMIGLVTTSSRAEAAPPGSQVTGPARGGGEQLIELRFPESTSVPILVDYVSQRLGVNIVYDESIRKKRVTISSPTKVSEDSLLGFLQSVLKMSGLLLIDAEQPGWKKIVVDKDLLAVTDTLESDLDRLAAAEATAAITQVFQLRHVPTVSAERTLKPFLGKPGGNALSIPEQNILIVTDRAGSLKRITALLDLIDRPGPRASIRFITVQHLEADQLATRVTNLLSEKAKVATVVGKPALPKLTLVADKRSNQIAVVAREGSETEAIELIEALDVPAYEAPSPVRFYKLVNTTAAEVLATIRSLAAGEEGLGGITLEIPDAPAQEPSKDKFVGPNRPPSERGQELPKPPAYRPSDSREDEEAQAAPLPATRRVKTKDAIVAVDTNTNTLIVVAAPAIQAVYAELISKLDKRRPQVMIEVTLVTLDTSGGFSLGVELSQSDLDRSPKHLVFSSFGLSTVDTDVGSLALKPGVGFNGIVIDPGMFAIVMKALASDGRTDVLSAPKVLVNDNATATMTSVSESPFTSVNASDTVATTSFGGYASAGTTLTATPHIGEGDHLQLKYSVTLNSFVGEGGEGIPPPRQTNSISSEVTIPDGYAVIIGGLKRKDFTKTVSKIPFLGDVPLLKYLFSSRTTTEAESTLFVFIRPTILRDDKFEHLKYLSDRELARAKLPPNLPPCDLMIIQ